jgi:bacillithiol biosynthesis cysteine-adding enzyme BshC
MSFQKTEINLDDARLLSKLVSHYIIRSNNVKSFYAEFPDANGFQSLIQKRNDFPVNRKLITEVLSDQNKESHESVKKNILLLGDAKTFTVTTGHQLNLFTGPLYFIYKILTAIKLSRWLNEKFPGNKFIPVYWMASEDHDIAEINHTFISGKKIEWTTAGTGAAGRLKCSGIESVIEELKTVLNSTSETDKLISIISEAYDSSHSLSVATRILVNALFGKYGLVIIDADNAKLKKQFAPLMKEELLKGISFEKTSATIASLEKMNYEIQVTPRELNLFYLEENSRERIVKEKNTFRVLNSEIKWSETEILNELENHPERFSPNVVLRSLYQETTLPNVAYVGGPAEIAYWLEYKSLFEHTRSSFPVLVLRNCAMISDQNAGRKMEKLKIAEADLFKSLDVLSNEFVKSDGAAFEMTEETKRINEVFDSLQIKASSVDPTLSGYVAAEKQKQLNALKSIEEKMIRAEKKKQETSIQQIQKLKDKFFPGGNLQERHENFIPFFLNHGETFFDDLLESFQPVSTEFHFLMKKEIKN